MAIRSGTRANHATQSRFPGGKDAVSKTPVRIEYNIFFVDTGFFSLTALIFGEESRPKVGASNMPTARILLSNRHGLI
jgi:hypothetical protein